MEYEKELNLVLWGIALVAMFFLARGITGNVIGDLSINSFCSSNIDCEDNKMCCMINGIGNCNSYEMCNELKNFAKEKPLIQRNYNFDITFGLLILMCVLIAVYNAVRNKKKKANTRVNKKVKRRR